MNTYNLLFKPLYLALFAVALAVGDLPMLSLSVAIAQNNVTKTTTTTTPKTNSTTTTTTPKTNSTTTTTPKTNSTTNPALTPIPVETPKPTTITPSPSLKIEDQLIGAWELKESTSEQILTYTFLKDGKLIISQTSPTYKVKVGYEVLDSSKSPMVIRLIFSKKEVIEGTFEIADGKTLLLKLDKETKEPIIFQKKSEQATTSGSLPDKNTPQAPAKKSNTP